MRIRSLAAASAAALLLAGCGGTTVSAPPPLSSSLPPGSPPPLPDDAESPLFEAKDLETREGGSAEFTSQTGSGSIEIVDYGWSDQAENAAATPPQENYLVVTAKVSCDDGECYHNPAAFRADSGEGWSDFTGGRDGFGPLLGTGTLQPGDEVDGIITFDLPPDSATIAFLDEYDEVAAEIELPAP